MLAPRDSDAAAIRTLAMPAHPGGSKYDCLMAKAKSASAARTIVVHPCDETSLRGTLEAAETGIIVPILVGPAAKITAVAREHNLEIGKFELVDAPHSDAVAAMAVELIHQGKGELLMKAACTPTSSCGP